jgi:hypothetical protein
MAITVTKPMGTATGLSASLVAGGSLKPSTTYYYIVIGYNNKQFSATTSYTPFHSDISAEGSFNTTTTDLSAHITWTNPAEHTSQSRYQILISETSGSYEGIGGYLTNREDIGDVMTDGAVGYTVTAESTETEVFHSIQLRNTQTANIGKELGIIRVDLDGGNYDLDDIYDAIVAAGFSSYVSYDGYTFVFKGWFISTGTDSGQLTVIRKSLVFLKGGVYCGNPNYIIRFGQWNGDEYGGYSPYGCRIDFQNSRYPIKSYYDGTLQIYGSLLTSISSLVNDVSEAPLSGGYYNGGSQQYLSQKVEGIRDTICGFNMRSQTSDAQDLKIGQGNNFSNYNHIRLKNTNVASMPYKKGGKFYACEFITASYLPIYAGSSHATAGYYTDMYDCLLPLMDEGLIKEGSNDVRYTTVTAPNYVTDYILRMNYSVKLRVLDETGALLEGATVSAVDKDGNPVTWVEHDGSFDRLVTGNSFTSDRTSDVNGIVDFYTESYTVIHNPENTGTGTNYNYLVLEKFPITVTVSKAGFRSEEMIIDSFSDKFENDIYLSPPVYYHQAITGDTGAVNISGDISDDSVNGQVVINQITGQIEEDIS